jgi:hypothetical protein
MARYDPNTNLESYHYTDLLDEKTSGKNYLPTFISLHIEYLIHGPHRKQNVQEFFY